MVKVKICGIKTLQDVEFVNRQKPDFIGFVFYPLSKRYVSLITARSLKVKLNKKIKSIGVFVNAPPEEIAAAAELGIINMVQLHGDETNAYIAELRKICTLPIIKAVRVREESDIKKAAFYNCEYFLFDTYSTASYGGTGRQFDTQLLKGVKINKPYFLAGGLNAGNVRSALKGLKPYAVDVSGGVENGGSKDETKIKNFIKQVKG
jgi:phosphoribosylanthranilate isomerase